MMRPAKRDAKNQVSCGFPGIGHLQFLGLSKKDVEKIQANMERETWLKDMLKTEGGEADEVCDL